MNKKILLGSIIAVAILLLMPSIPAIQLNNIEDVIQDNLEKQPSLTEIKEIITGEQLPRHPILFLMVWMIAAFRLNRAWYLEEISSEWVNENGWNPHLEITHPLLFLRFLMLFVTIEMWFGLWEGISYLLDWDWYF